MHHRHGISTGYSLPYIVFIASVAALGGFLFGFDTAVINGAVIAIRNHFGVGGWATGLVVSLALLGSAGGALIAGPLADRIGRRPSMMIAAALFFISAIGSGLPVTIWDFTMWRVLGGIAVGAASVIAPAYIAEVSPAAWRGRLGSLQQLAIVTGIFIALLSNYFIGKAAGGAEHVLYLDVKAWRWMFWMEGIPAILYGVAAILIVESPRYLVARSRDEEAAEVLNRVVGHNVQAKIVEIRQTLVRHHRSHWREIVGRWGVLPVVWLGIGLSIFQQFVGINVIFYYGSVLWRSVGFTEEDALWITMITGVTNVITTLVAIATIDRFGRKPLLLAGSIGMAGTLGTLAWVFSMAPVNELGQPELSGMPGIVGLIAANLYVFCFGFSWGPVVWVLLGEMFSNRIRAVALAVAASVQWIANFTVSTTFPPMAEGLGLGGSYAVYTFFATLSFIFVLMFVHETKGKELEAMAD